jgi:hypothetical protein
MLKNIHILNHNIAPPLECTTSKCCFLSHSVQKVSSLLSPIPVSCFAYMSRGHLKQLFLFCFFQVCVQIILAREHVDILTTK